MLTDTPMIPPALLAKVAHHMAALRAWHAALVQARAMEVVAGQPGRFEYDLRYTDAGARLRHRAIRAAETLTALEQDALEHGVPVEALYAACGGSPPPLPEGDAVRQWGRGKNT